MSSVARSTPATTTRPAAQMSPAPGFNIVRKGARRAFLGDFYHSILTLSWWWFMAAVLATQVVLNALFGVLFWWPGGQVANASTQLEHFYFSVQTWATIGYGGMTPVSTWSNMLVVAESFVATIFTAVTTGLVFAKFARPSARVLFAKNAIITKRDGKRVFMFRVANERGNYVVEANVRCSVLRDEVTAEGDRMRRIYDLTLVRTLQPMFLMTWTVMHEIDEKSPLFNKSDAEIRAEKLRFSVSLMGFDGTLAQSIHASHLYSPNDILHDVRYVDVTEELPDGRLLLDFTRFHEVAPLGAVAQVG